MKSIFFIVLMLSMPVLGQNPMTMNDHHSYCGSGKFWSKNKSKVDKFRVRLIKHKSVQAIQYRAVGVKNWQSLSVKSLILIFKFNDKNDEVDLFDMKIKIATGKCNDLKCSFKHLNKKCDEESTFEFEKDNEFILMKRKISCKEDTYYMEWKAAIDKFQPYGFENC